MTGFTTSVATTYNGNPDDGGDPNAQFGQVASCNQDADNCIGANGGAFGSFLITDSVTAFTLHVGMNATSASFSCGSRPRPSTRSSG